MTTSNGFTLWFTGLPCSGKTTVSRLVAQQLRDMAFRVEVLDGDEVRRWLSKDLGFSRKDRREHLIRVRYIAKLLSRNGVAVLAAFVTPYDEIRVYLRTGLKNYIEVYVKCPLEVCMQRDVKGMYAKAQAGLIPHFTGVSAPYEEPLNPEIIIDTDYLTPAGSARKVVEFVLDHYHTKESEWRSPF